MDFQDRYVKIYRPQQYVSLEAYHRIRVSELASDKPKSPEYKDKPGSSNRIHHIFAAILNILGR